MIQTKQIVVTRPGPYLNSNQRLHWAEEAKLVAVWRDAAFWACKQHRLGCRRAIGPVEVFFEFGTKQPNKRRDPGNFWPTQKAWIDGCTHAAVWEDDDSKHVKTYEATFTDDIPADAMRVTLIWKADQ